MWLCCRQMVILTYEYSVCNFGYLPKLLKSHLPLLSLLYRYVARWKYEESQIRVMYQWPHVTSNENSERETMKVLLFWLRHHLHKCWLHYDISFMSTRRFSWRSTVQTCSWMGKMEAWKKQNWSLKRICTCFA